MILQKYHKIIAEKLGISIRQIDNTIALLEEGATIPFLSRYRKEATGSLDEVAIGKIKDEKEKFEELEKRKVTILKTIEEQEQLSPELKNLIDNCYDLNELEDIYLPYKPKRRTRAMIAREKGLEPLAKMIMKQYEPDPENRAQQFVNDDVPDTTAALAGARDIVAEWVNENQAARNIVRKSFGREAIITSKVVKGKEEEGVKYRDYFDSGEPLKHCPSHRILAMRRGENEGFLKLNISPDEEKTVSSLENYFVKGRNESAFQVALAVKDCYKRLLAPAIETEFLSSSKEQADAEAIKVLC